VTSFIIPFFIYFVLLGTGIPDVGVGMQDLQSPTEESQHHKHHSEGR